MCRIPYPPLLYMISYENQAVMLSIIQEEFTFLVPAFKMPFFYNFQMDIIYNRDFFTILCYQLCLSS
jgi:hypothetical protein